MQISDEMLGQLIQELIMLTIKRESTPIIRWRRMVISLPETQIKFWWKRHLDGTYEADEISYKTRLNNFDLYNIINDQLKLDKIPPRISRR